MARWITKLSEQKQEESSHAIAVPISQMVVDLADAIDPRCDLEIFTTDVIDRHHSILGVLTVFRISLLLQNVVVSELDSYVCLLQLSYR